MTKRALITGITGQDGSYLAEFLLEQGYEVHGLVRPTARNTFGQLRVADDVCVHLHECDLMGDCLSFAHELAEFDEVYNLAAQSHVGTSFDTPFETHQVNAVAPHRLMDSLFRYSSEARFYQASTSELYGDVTGSKQSELTRFNPVSPYGISKQYAYEVTKLYRRQGNFACNGIPFNHESPRRHPYFVTRKITQAVARIVHGKQDVLTLGNLNARRDWGHAQDYVRGMWMMLQQDHPDDYVLATGEVHTVREFVTAAFAVVDIPIRWWGDGEEEVGTDGSTGVTRVRVNPAYYRPDDVHYLCGDASKAQKVLGWRPQNTFEDLVQEMVGHDMLLWGE